MISPTSSPKNSDTVIKQFICLLLTAVCTCSTAQNAFGIKASGGFSKITESPFTSTEELNISYHFVPSGQAGVFYESGFGKSSIFAAELLFTQTGSKEIIEYSIPARRCFVAGTSTLTQNIQISYLSLPLYYGLKINK